MNGARWSELAMVAAVRYDLFTDAQELLEAGVDPDFVTPNGASLACLATAHEDGEVLRLLVAAGADLERAGEDGFAPLACAIAHGHDEVASWLIAQGAVLDRVSAKGMSPLVAAGVYGRADWVRRLLAAGVNGTQGSFEGYPPLVAAIRYGHEHAARMLLDDVRSRPEAASQLDLALQAAANRCMVRLIDAMLGAKGAAADLMARAGTKAAFAALDCRDDAVAVEAVRRLLAAGLDPRAMDERGRPLVFAAVDEWSSGVEALLIEAGAPVDARNYDGRTALMEAASSDEQLEVLDRLLRFDPDLDAKEASGWTALMFAARSGNAQGVERLLESGAAPDLRNVEGKCAADLAREGGHLDLIRKLQGSK